MQILSPRSRYSVLVTFGCEVASIFNKPPSRACTVKFESHCCNEHSGHRNRVIKCGQVRLSTGWQRAGEGHWKRGLHSGPCEGRSLNRWKTGGSRKVRVKLSQRKETSLLVGFRSPETIPGNWPAAP